jgi:hypothetical protein
MTDPQSAQPAEPALEVVTETPLAELDPDYFYLSQSIDIDGQPVNRLRINPRGVLRGKQFFDLIGRYQRKFPEEARTSINKYVSENFLSLVIAQINEIAPEDLYKVEYGDLPLMFLQAATFHFGAGRPTTTTAAAPVPENAPSKS